MYKHIAMISFLITSIFWGAAGAQDVDYSGTSAANFLKIGVGARAVAMGDAASAVVDDASALFWNVAAIAGIENNISVVISSMNWLVDTRYSYVAAAMKIRGLGSFGVDMQFLDYGNIEETTVYDQNGTGRYFSANDLSIGLGYARQSTDRFSFGIKLKYIAEKLANANANAIGIDVGAVFITSFFNNNLRLAASLSNFGTKMQFSGRDLAVIYEVPGSPSGKQIPASLSTMEWEVPLLFRFGLSNYFVKNDAWTLLASYDILDSRDFNVRHSLGVEIGFKNSIYLRGGYKFNYDEMTYSGGIGMDFSRFLGYNITLDYSYNDFGVFGPFNQFSFIVNL